MKLHPVTVTFNRVFDVVRARGYETPAHTLFGFESSERSFHGIKVPGHPRIEAGDTVTALLGRPTNWQTLRGWVNHRTQEIAAPSVAQGAITAGAMLAAAILCLYLAGLTASSLLALPFFAGVAYWAWYTMAAIVIRRGLQRHGALYLSRDSQSE
jgi:hypothetical protein